MPAWHGPQSRFTGELTTMMGHVEVSDFPLASTTFAVMLYVFNAGDTLFRSGWFVESLATQTLVIFAIRTRRVPFFRSVPSKPLLAATIACAAVGVALPYSPLSHILGFKALPVAFLGVLVGMIVTYLGLVEVGKRIFFGRLAPSGRAPARPKPSHERRLHRRAAGWSGRAPVLQKKR